MGRREEYPQNHIFFSCKISGCFYVNRVTAGECLPRRDNANRKVKNLMSIVKETFRILPPGRVILKGRLGKALERSMEHRLRRVDYSHLVAPFRERNETDGRWRCEFWGKIVRSAIRSLHGRPDAELERLVRATVAELLETQTADGCISSYPAPLQTGDWDIWGRKYALLGLLRYANEIEASPEIRRAVARCLDQLISQVGPEAKPILECGHHTGLAASSILGAVVKGYRLTGEKRFLDYALWIAGQGCSSKENLFAAIRRGTPPDGLGNGKAYEMTSCVEGLLELYRETGDPEQLETALVYYRAVRDREIFITGVGGLKDTWGEYWFDGTQKQTRDDVGALGETCVTTTYLRFCCKVLRLAGDISAADEMERSLYNGILGAMVPDGSWWLHANPTPLAGSSFKKRAGDQIPGYGEDCCVAQGPEGLAVASLFAVMADDSGVVVNLYEACDAVAPLPEGGEVKLRITGEYPDRSAVRIEVEPDRKRCFRLKLRMPRWSRATRISVGNESFRGAPGGYFDLAREWMPGDRIELEFDLSFTVVGAPGDGSRIAVVRGPVVLAQDSRLGSVDVPVDSAAIAGAEVLEPPTPEFHHLYRLADGSVLCDYAAAGNRFSEENTLCVWMKKRER